MVNIRNSYTSRIALLAFLTLLTLGTVSGLSWTNPAADGADFDQDVVLNVTGTPGGDVTLQVREPGEQNFTEITTTTFNGDGNYSTTFNAGTTGSGDYDFLANESKTNNVTVSSITLDSAAPSISSKSPTGYTSSDSMTVSFDVSDSHTGVNSSETFIQLERVGGDIIDNSSSSSLSVSDLSDGDYRVNYEAEDNVGNRNTGSWTFIVDTAYEGGTDPTVSYDPQVFRADGGDYRFVVNVSEGSEPSDIKVVCMNEQATIDETNYKDVNGYDTFNCDLDSSSYRDVAINLNIELRDQAGNSFTKSIGEYTFDFSSPEFGNLSSVVSVFNSDFDLDYDGYDEASSISKIHYQLNDNTFSLDKGSNASAEGDFTVAVDGLSEGSNMVYAWAVDEAGRWSERADYEFNYLPNAEPKVALNTPSEVHVTSGDFTSFDVSVSNTGQLLIEDLKVRAESDVFNNTKTIAMLEPEQSINLTYDVDTEPSDLGVHPVQVSTESPSESQDVSLVVEANEDQQQAIQQKFDRYLARYQSLDANVSQLLPRLNDKRASALKDNYSEFNDTLTAAIEAKENGEYYRVEELLSNVDTEYETAESSFNEVQQSHRVAQRNKLIGFLLLGLVLLGGAGVGYFAVYRDDYYFDLEALEDLEFIDDLKETDFSEKIHELKRKVSEFIEKEEEELGEYSFDGFK